MNFKGLLGKAILGLGAAVVVQQIAPSAAQNPLVRGAAGFALGGAPAAVGAAFGGQILATAQGAMGGMTGGSTTGGSMAFYG